MICLVFIRDHRLLSRRRRVGAITDAGDGLTAYTEHKPRRAATLALSWGASSIITDRAEDILAVAA